VSAVSRVAIVGSDAVAMLAALALHKAFRHRALEVTVIGAIRVAPGGACWTLPSLRGLHALIGIGEADLLRATNATYKLGTEFTGFQGEGSRYIHAHGDIGNDIGAAPFWKFLVQERLAGKPGNPEDYSIAAAAAKGGRFARPMGDDSALTSSFTYGFHLDEAAYARFLLDAARGAGVTVLDDTVAAEERDERGRVRTLVLAAGPRIDTDFVIHTSRAADADGDRHDWSAWLPCDRRSRARAAADASPPPVTKIAAEAAGWNWRVPLADATATGRVWSSTFGGDDPDAVKIRNGRRRRFWTGNTLYLGEAAMQLEPLIGGGLHFAQLGIANLVELFPFDSASDVESEEYDRIVGEHADALRDFTIAHYRAGKPRRGAFWDATRAAELPDTLAHKLDLYRANGRIDLRDHESFEELDWAWLLLGAGDLPRALELQITMHLRSVAAGVVAPLAQKIQWLAASMPRHIDYVKGMKAPRP
jgi:tryptophan halogenase